VFEVLKRSLARRACARANQQEMTTCAKSGGPEEIFLKEKREQSPIGRASTHSRRAITGRWTTLEKQCVLYVVDFWGIIASLDNIIECILIFFYKVVHVASSLFSLRNFLMSL
jgi:hypothetical protein